MIFQTNVNCEETVRNKKPVCIKNLSTADQCPGINANIVLLVAASEQIYVLGENNLVWEESGSLGALFFAPKLWEKYASFGSFFRRVFLVKRN